MPRLSIRPAGCLRAQLRRGLMAVLILQTGCMHVAAADDQAVEIQENTDRLVSSPTLPLTADYIIYQPSVLPLQSFFTRLATGEFTQAFDDVAFRYQPATSSNAALQTLLDEGFIPVYVQLNNFGAQPLKVSEQNFRLVGNGKALAPITPKELPHVLAKFNAKALGANIYNGTLVVVGTVAAIFIVVVAVAGSAKGRGGINIGNLYTGSGPLRGQTSSSSAHSEVFNSTTKTTQIDYKDYLLRQIVLPPDSSIGGLIFFKAKTPLNFAGLSLRLK